MTSSTYGTAELQGDASPSSPKPYRLSKVAKIALALIACGAAVITHPSTRQATTSFVLDAYSSFGNPNDLADQDRSGRGPRGAPADSTSLKDEVQDLEARVTAIEGYLQGTSASATLTRRLQNTGREEQRVPGPGVPSQGSNLLVDDLTRKIMNSPAGLLQLRDQLRSARNPQGGKLAVAEVIEDLRDRVVNIEKYLQATHDSGSSGTSRAWEAYTSLHFIDDPENARSGGGTPVASTPLKDQVQDLQARVAAIEKYLQAAGGSGNSRQQIHQMLQHLAASAGGNR